MSAIPTREYERIPFPVSAVQVTEELFEDLAEWCKGKIRTDPQGKKYIEVYVQRPADDRQTKAYPGDWLLFAGRGFKVYLDVAFKRCFRLVPSENEFDLISDEELESEKKIFTNTVETIAEQQRSFAEKQS